MKQELIDKIAIKISELFNGVCVYEIKSILDIELYNYDITKRQTDIVVYEGNINDLLVKQWLASKIVKGCSKRTIEYYTKISNLFLKKMNKNLKDITTDDIKYYLAHREFSDHISKVSQDNELRVFRSLFTYLANEEKIEKNPTIRIEKIKTQKKVRSPFTEDELEKLRHACNTRYGLNKKHLAIIETLYSTGCRVSELCGMDIENIDGDRIIVLGKGNKERYVYLNARAKFAIDDYLKTRNDKFPALFIGTNIATKQISPRIDKSSVESIIRRIGKRAGVEDAHPHRFRRTAATLALRRGMPIEQVSKMLGHESIATTQIYAITDEKDVYNSHKKYVI